MVHITDALFVSCFQELFDHNINVIAVFKYNLCYRERVYKKCY
jgi:hypothetical protein